MTEARLPRIFIIEGITGAGKDTLCNRLLELLHSETRPVYYFPEESVGFYYYQIFWPGITNIRLSLMEQALDFVEEESYRMPNALFMFNRFHLSLKGTISRILGDLNFDRRYTRLVKRVTQMRVLVLLLQINEQEIPTYIHPERGDKSLVWKQFLRRVAEQNPYETVQQLFAAQQRRYNQLAREQGLPYQAGTLNELLHLVASL